jgi:alkyl hydroperoxide reductase subunit AhpC
MQQLQLFGKEIDALKKLNTELVSLSTDDVEPTKAPKENAEGVRFPMPLLADPKLDTFRGPLKLAPQQNLWVCFGPGSAPRI